MLARLSMARPYPEAQLLPADRGDQREQRNDHEIPTGTQAEDVPLRLPARLRYALGFGARHLIFGFTPM
jgi:hypothetical protein